MNFTTTALAVLSAASCSSEAPDDDMQRPLADAAVDDPADASTGYLGEGTPWPDKSFNERLAYMEEVVLPTMKAKLEAFDDDRFEDVECETCHGPDPLARDYAMPSGTLPSLPAEKEDDELEQFMRDEVTSTMVELLDAAPYDRTTGEGFGCTKCHGEAS